MTTPFIRPEAREALLRWRETLAAGALAALGLWWLVTGYGLIVWAGGALALAAGGAAIASFRKARFRSRGGGVGVVELDEGRLSYFGPLTGGAIAVREIAEVAIDRRHRPAHWALSDGAGELLIPVDAAGADALLDVFAQLPGLDLGAVLGAREGPRNTRTTLWRRGGTVPMPRRLHS